MPEDGRQTHRDLAWKELIVFFLMATNLSPTNLCVVVLPLSLHDDYGSDVHYGGTHEHGATFCGATTNRLIRSY